jgi:hypothetical protein
MSDPAIGTDAHSHPGRTHPAAPAIGTASLVFFGRTRAKNVGGTYAAITADRTAPRMRNGVACTMIATKTVDAV